MLDVPKKSVSPVRATVPVAAPGAVAPTVQLVPLKFPLAGVLAHASLAAQAAGPESNEAATSKPENNRRLGWRATR